MPKRILVPGMRNAVSSSDARASSCATRSRRLAPRRYPPTSFGDIRRAKDLVVRSHASGLRAWSAPQAEPTPAAGSGSGGQFPAGAEVPGADDRRGGNSGGRPPETSRSQPVSTAPGHPAYWRISRSPGYGAILGLDELGRQSLPRNAANAPDHFAERQGHAEIRHDVRRNGGPGHRHVSITRQVMVCRRAGPASNTVSRHDPPCSRTSLTS